MPAETSDRHGVTNLRSTRVALSTACRPIWRRASLSPEPRPELTCRAVERLACRDEQSVTFGAAEGNVGDDLRDTDTAEELAGRIPHCHTPL